jgi:hypothetical protein
MMKIFLMCILVMLVLTVSYGFWHLARHINYSLSYEAQVKETVCEMVKPEHLKSPC